MGDHRTRAELRAENEKLRARVAHLEGALAAAVTLSAGASDGIQTLSAALGGDISQLLRDLLPGPPLTSVQLQPLPTRPGQDGRDDEAAGVVRAPVLHLPTRIDHMKTAGAEAPATADTTQPTDKD